MNDVDPYRTETRPVVEIEMMEDAEGPAYAQVGVPRASMLRRAFFDELGAERPSAVAGGRATTAGGSSGVLPPLASSPFNGVTIDTETAQRVGAAALNEAYQQYFSPALQGEGAAETGAGGNYEAPEYAGTVAVLPPRESGRMAPSSRDRVRAGSAMLANVVAGSLVGAGVRRATSSLLASVAAGVVLSQSLCWLGYGHMEWGAVLADLYHFVLHGARTPEGAERESSSKMHYYAQRLCSVLTATIPRRLSFWAGAAGGFLFLS